MSKRRQPQDFHHHQLHTKILTYFLPRCLFLLLGRWKLTLLHSEWPPNGPIIHRALMYLVVP